MIRQKSFENELPTLYLVPTPIGNRSEMSPRAIEVLQSVDVIACEDTRTSGQLLKFYDIHNRLISYQKHNEETSSKGILKLLQEGSNVALISDAGYPLINDPGQTLVTLVSQAGFNVVPVSGPNAMLNALVASGLVAQPFLFVGFLPAKEKEARQVLKQYEPYPMTTIYYEAPHRIKQFLNLLLEVFGNRKICLARELTKIHEEFLRGTIEEVLEVVDELRGEMVVVVEGKANDNEVTLDYGLLLEKVEHRMEQGLSTKDAIAQVAKETGVAKNQIKNLVFTGKES